MPWPAPRQLFGVYWHQGQPRWQVTDFASPARTQGRFHDVGDRGAWYASTQEQGAWAELLRHHADAISPAEQRRRVGRVRVSELAVLDLTDPKVRDMVGVQLTDLVGDDTAATREIARRARSRYDGLLAPSAALPGCSTLVVFPQGMNTVEVELDRVRRTPSRVLDLLDRIVLLPAARQWLDALVGEAIKRRRQLL